MDHETIYDPLGNFSTYHNNSTTTPIPWSTDSGFTYQDIRRYGERIAVLEARKNRDAEFGERIRTLEVHQSHLIDNIKKHSEDIKHISEIENRLSIIESDLTKATDQKWKNLTKWLSIFAIIVSCLSPFITYFLGHSGSPTAQLTERSVAPK
ncbi:hypothetical protein [Desulfovibrio piger]|uniref:hypothetical protein n=1 Tax=Desulfovibrio piger TaxID=901 RepID=UPI00242DB79B|nr:hypothetical protein [Desulfovibrio piger]MCI6941714.1 hypothetical protein [Desulfovibrio piger]